MSIPILVRRLPHAEGLPLPSYATTGAACMDLIAAVRDPVTVGPGERVLIPTGLTVALPSGYELQVRPRSGLALRHGITLPNAPGTIDEDYRGYPGSPKNRLGRTQRRNRLKTLFQLPNSAGRSRQGNPARIRHSTASRNRRLSFAVTPRSDFLPGNRASIFFQTVSLTTN
jgi:hypothetical protein